MSTVLRLTHRDRAGLRWLHQRCHTWRHNFNLHRKYQAVPGANFTPEEIAVLEALTGLEATARQLLKVDD